MPAEKPFRRSRRHRVLGGVCGGLAEWLDWNPVLVRVLFAIFSLLHFVPGILVYIVLWVMIPEQEP